MYGLVRFQRASTLTTCARQPHQFHLSTQHHHQHQQTQYKGSLHLKSCFFSEKIQIFLNRKNIKMKPKPTLRKICGCCPAEENFNWELMSSDRKSSVVISGNNSTAYCCRITPARAAPPPSQDSIWNIGLFVFIQHFIICGKN